jgi:hypothetical protein
MRHNNLAKSILAIAAIFGLSACGMMRPTEALHPTKASSYRTAAVQTGKVVADLEIEQAPQSATATDRAGASIDELKSLAIRSALSEHGGDVLLEPSFLVEETASTVAVTVTGYIARYVNLQQAHGETLKVSASHPGSAPPEYPDPDNTPTLSREDADTPAQGQAALDASASRQEEADVQPQKKKEADVQPQKKKEADVQPQKKKPAKASLQKKKKK